MNELLSADDLIDAIREYNPSTNVDLIEKASEAFPKTHTIINEVDKTLMISVDEFYYISVIQNLLANAI